MRENVGCGDQRMGSGCIDVFYIYFLFLTISQLRPCDKDKENGRVYENTFLAFIHNAEAPIEAKIYVSPEVSTHHRPQSFLIAAGVLCSDDT